MLRLQRQSKGGVIQKFRGGGLYKAEEVVEVEVILLQVQDKL